MEQPETIGKGKKIIWSSRSHYKLDISGWSDQFKNDGWAMHAADLYESQEEGNNSNWKTKWTRACRESSFGIILQSIDYEESKWCRAERDLLRAEEKKGRLRLLTLQEEDLQNPDETLIKIRDFLEAVGPVYDSGSDMGSNSCKVHSAPSPSMTSTQPSDYSRPSTQKAIDSDNESCDVLLIDPEFCGPHLTEKRDELKLKGFDVCLKCNVELFSQVNKFVRQLNPSIVYIEDRGGEGLPWKLNLENEFILELANFLGNGKVDEGPWNHWRGCMLNLGKTQREIMNKLCNKQPGKLNVLTWAEHPDKPDREQLWVLFSDYLDRNKYEQNKQDAFAQACDKAISFFKPDRLILAPSRPVAPSAQAKQTRRKWHPHRKLICRLEGGDAPTIARELTAADPRITASLEVKMIVQPDVEEAHFKNADEPILRELENNLKEVVGEKVDFRATGSLYVRMSLAAFDKFKWRVCRKDSGLDLKLPAAWGPGETRITQVRPGRTCWLQAIMPAEEVHMLCNHLCVQLEKMKSEQVICRSCRNTGIDFMGKPCSCSFGKAKAKAYARDGHTKFSGGCIAEGSCVVEEAKAVGASTGQCLDAGVKQNSTRAEEVSTLAEAAGSPDEAQAAAETPDGAWGPRTTIAVVPQGGVGKIIEVPHPDDPRQSILVAVPAHALVGQGMLVPVPALTSTSTSSECDFQAASQKVDGYTAEEWKQKVDGYTAEQWKSVGDVAIKKGDYAAAYEAYSKGLQAHPNHTIMLSNRALCLEKLGRQEEEELRVRTLAGRIVFSTKKQKVVGDSVTGLREKIKDICGVHFDQVVLFLDDRRLSHERLQPILKPVGDVEMILVLDNTKTLADKAISIKQLLKFYLHYKIDSSWKTEDVARDIVFPQTQGKHIFFDHHLCYMDSAFMEHGGARCMRVPCLVSHSWQSPFLNTVLTILLDAGLCLSLLRNCCNVSGEFDAEKVFGKILKHGDEMLNKTYWLDIFAISQHTKGSMSTQARLDQLNNLVGSMKGLVVSLDSKLQTLRCPLVIAEISEAIKKKPIHFGIHGALDTATISKLMNGDLVIPPVAECDFTDPDDKRRILEKIDSIGGRDAFDKYLLCIVEVNFDIQKCSGCIADKPRKAPGHPNALMKFPALFGQELKEMTSLQQLKMDFGYCKSLQDISGLCRGLKKMKSLQLLHMNFHSCLALQDTSALGQGLKEMKSLQHFQMDFSGCEALRDISALGHGLTEMKGLRYLHMDFSSCKSLQDISALGQGLKEMKSLQHFQMDFSSCLALQDISALGQGLTEMKSLQHFEMNFSGCEALRDISALGHGLTKMKDLQCFSMDFGYCKSLQDISALGHGLKEMKDCQDVWMDFRECTSLQDISALGQGLKEMKDLQYLHMGFEECKSLQDISALGQGLKDTTSLKNGALIFYGCIALVGGAASVKSLHQMLTKGERIVVSFGGNWQMVEGWEIRKG